MTATPGPQQPDEVEVLAERLQQADPDGVFSALTDRPVRWDDPHVDRDHYRTFAAALLAEQPGGWEVSGVRLLHGDAVHRGSRATAAPGPQQPDGAEREADAFVHLVRTLLMSYTPAGAVTWLTIRNRHLDVHQPIDRWTQGYEAEVQEVADLIDGGHPAAPSAQPDEVEVDPFDEVRRERAELARLARKYHLDNHHNAAMCPYCRPTQSVHNTEERRR